MKLALSCDAHYYSQFMSTEQSQALFEWLKSNFDLTEPEKLKMPNGEEVCILPWRMIFVSPEFDNNDVFSEHHGRRAPWFPLLEQLRQQIKDCTGIEFSVGVCLYYPDGEEYMGFHTDLPAFGSTDVIASISLGAEREFLIREQNNPEIQQSVTLGDGSLLVMGNGFQDQYEHAVAKGSKETGPRFNISFRQFKWAESTTKANC
ncbi:alpha-ketoglutarate-dependent dioxygenase AlkB [Pseudoalteromonas sp. T1lg23B]|uniref:alpha-ketoglutarate-dependent dioxygenase AlkB n=1 Tax=Pseudoalteromonas sp. T1lg23B TaxID=2077097 RepID=UPI000CF71488|nr:alpha-ketoglutarate-dependent dioxygenase AlkB [Pseudoalteromonas sp. T1lg23B]